MEIEQVRYKAENGWEHIKNSKSFDQNSASLVLAFGKKEIIQDTKIYEDINTRYPHADVILCSTAGEILGSTVEDETVVSSALQFQKTNIRIKQVNIRDFGNSYDVGKFLTEELRADDLKHILVFSDGQLVNGNQLVNGFRDHVSEGVLVSGGLAGDGPHFGSTLVGLNGESESGNIVGIGFYGNSLMVSSGSKGGWDEFGPHRTVTKSDGKVLYELDGQSALDLYKRYLGPQAENLPWSGLSYPLSLRERPDSEPVVRTTHNIDEDEQTLIFSGDIPEGSTVRMMKGNFDRIIEGAAKAALESKKTSSVLPEFVLMVSCAGRKLVLDQRIEEEIEVIEDIFGKEAFYTGFYSYSEISPSTPGGLCDLHNQTMTLTTYSEL